MGTPNKPDDIIIIAREPDCKCVVGVSFVRPHRNLVELQGELLDWLIDGLEVSFGSEEDVVRIRQCFHQVSQRPVRAPDASALARVDEIMDTIEVIWTLRKE